jgi:hypothetical protein
MWESNTHFLNVPILIIAQVSAQNQSMGVDRKNLSCALLKIVHN